MRFDSYQTQGFKDEMFDDAGVVRPEARLLLDTIESLDEGQLQQCQQAAERLLLQMGITFNVYGDSAGTEKIFPFDLVPRIVSSAEWNWIERGLKQRITALNLFINEFYHDKKIIKERFVPAEIMFSAKSFRKQCIGLNPPLGIWC